MSRPALDLKSEIHRALRAVDRLVEDERFSRDAVLDALLDIETHCQEWREALASDARREALDGAGDGE